MSKHSSKVHVYTDRQGVYRTLTDGSDGYKARALMLQAAGFDIEVRGNQREQVLDALLKSIS